jgi:hypothetical protein
VIERLPGQYAIGHNRYSTTGGEGMRNVQPFFADFAGGGFAVAHNGNLTNAGTIREQLQHRGAIFQSTSDTEVILHLIAMSEEARLVAKLTDAVKQLEGAFSLVALSGKKMIGCRDALGVRPLVLGDVDGSYVLASETCALDIIGARFVRVSASLNTFILPVQIPRFRARMSMLFARKLVKSWRGNLPLKPISWCQFPIQEPPPLLALRKKPTCRLNWALSAITMWAVRLSRRQTISATWA